MANYGLPIGVLSPQGAIGFTDSSLPNVLGQAAGTQNQQAAQGGGVLGASTFNPGTYDPNAAANAQAAATKAANDAAVNSAVGRLGSQQSAGQQNILNSYQSAFQTLLGQQQAANTGLASQRNQTMTDNQTARDNIGANVRLTNQGLQRLLGSHGAGNSSTAQILAPLAAAQQGNIQRSQVQQTYGQNMNNLDNTQNANNIDYQNSFGQLATDRQQKEQDLLSGIESARANLLGQRSDAASNQAAINAILDSVTKLGVNPTFTPQVAQPKQADLSQYQYNPISGPQIANSGIDPSLAASVGPFLSLLTGQKKQALGA